MPKFGDSLGGSMMSETLDLPLLLMKGAGLLILGGVVFCGKILMA